MNKYFFLSVVIAMLLTTGCTSKSDSKEVATSTSEEAMTFPLNIQKGGQFQSLDQIRVQARSIIEYRIQQEEKPVAMLLDTYWWPEFVFNAGAMSAPEEYAGYWLKFQDDFTYNYGFYDREMGKGKYHYRLEDNKLFMLDDNVDMEPKVWTANYNGGIMALVGTHEYKVNNGMQIKMVGLTEKPAI